MGDRVLAWNETLGETSYYTVTDAYTDVHEVLVYLTIDGEELTTTPEHPFLQADGQWTPAGQVAVGNQIRRADGEIGVVEAVEFAATPQVMYNMTVADAHTYTVGDGEWVVHNDCDTAIRSLLSKLPNRNGVGKTSGYLLDSHGNIIGDMIVSGKNNPYFRDVNLVRGDSKLYTIQSHVEAQAAGRMRDLRISDATLVLNNHPCPGVAGCDALLPLMLAEGSVLRVIVPDGFDARGVLNKLYEGLRIGD